MNHTQIGVAFFLLALAIGCGTAGKPSTSAPAGGAAPPPPPVATTTTETKPSAPAARPLDAAAIEELQQAFAFEKSDAERDAATQKYKDQRFQFQGRVVGHGGDFVMVKLEGVSGDFLVWLETKAAAEYTVVHQDYQFEAIVKDFHLRKLHKATAVSDPGGPTAAEKAADPRKLFRYTNTKGKNFYSQYAMQGTFERSAGDVWIEKWTNGGQQEWREIRRTPEHIELSLPDGTLHLRLGKESAPIRIGKGEWEPAFTGTWQAEPKP